MSKGELNLTEPCITPQRATGQMLTMVGTAVRDAPSGGGGIWHSWKVISSRELFLQCMVHKHSSSYGIALVCIEYM